MPHAHEFQAAMRDHSLDLGEKAPLLAALAPLASPSAPRRLDIHRNNTMIGLADALADSYPVVARLVGEDCFQGLARAFVCAHPPMKPSLIAYGAEFPAFLAIHPVGAALPYLADVARLEAAWLHAYHGPEAQPMQAADFAAIPAGQWDGLRLALHPAHRFLASAWPVAAIWSANLEDEVAATDAGAGPQRLLVIRPLAEVVVMELGAGAFSLLMALALDQPLDAAWASARATDRAFDLEAELPALLAARIFVEARLP